MVVQIVEIWLRRSSAIAAFDTSDGEPGAVRIEAASTTSRPGRLSHVKRLPNGVPCIGACADPYFYQNSRTVSRDRQTSLSSQRGGPRAAVGRRMITKSTPGRIR